MALLPKALEGIRSSFGVTLVRCSGDGLVVEVDGRRDVSSAGLTVEGRGLPFSMIRIGGSLEGTVAARVVESEGFVEAIVAGGEELSLSVAGAELLATDGLELAELAAADGGADAAE